MPQNTRSNAVSDDGTDARIPPLLVGLAGRDPVVRENAREALVAIGEPAVPLLIQQLSHRRRHVRWEAAKALCDIADPIAATALVNALDDTDDDVRWVVAEGLTALGREGLQPLLAALLQRAQSCSFCEGAHHVCHALATKRKLGPILRPVLAALGQAEPAVGAPVAAYIALSKLRDLF
jgi:HEAT repeat protein